MLILHILDYYKLSKSANLMPNRKFTPGTQ